MRRISLVSLALTFLSSPVWAHHNPSSWYLEQVIHGEFDGYEGSPGNTVTYIEANESSGEMELSACCSDVDCSMTNTYLITWEVIPSAATATPGQTFEVHLTNELIAGNCLDIDPFISTCGQEGSPASQVTEQNITFDYPSNSLTYANCDRFYPDPVYYANIHVPSPHEVHLYDHENMPHDGYFWLNITHRWGMQYEVVWIYRTNEVAAGGAGGAGGSDGSGGAAPVGGAGGAGNDDLGDAGIDIDLPLGGSENGGSGSLLPKDGGGLDNDPGNNLLEAGTGTPRRRGGGGAGPCSVGTGAEGGFSVIALLMAAAALGRRRRP